MSFRNGQPTIDNSRPTLSLRQKVYFASTPPKNGPHDVVVVFGAHRRDDLSLSWCHAVGFGQTCRYVDTRIALLMVANH